METQVKVNSDKFGKQRYGCAADIQSVGDKYNKELCCNPNCTKTHCARHYDNHKQIFGAEDLNPDNRFKCQNYSPRFKSRLSTFGGNPLFKNLDTYGGQWQKLTK